MPTQIETAVVLPDMTLSLEVQTNATGVTGFRLTVDSVEVDVALTETLGYNAMKGTYYLPRAVALEEGVEVAVTATPLMGAAVGDTSEPVLVAAEHESAPETVVRYLVADALTGVVVYDDEPVWVWRDRMGRPRTARGPVGKPGAVIEVGVVYMSGEETDATDTHSDTTMSVPVRVLVKADDPDRGEDAVNIAWRVRGVLAEALDMNGFGIVGWNWTGTPPVQEGPNMIKLSMTMQVQRMGPRTCGA